MVNVGKYSQSHSLRIWGLVQRLFQNTVVQHVSPKAGGFFGSQLGVTNLEIRTRWWYQKLFMFIATSG